MKKLQIDTTADVGSVFEHYPEQLRPKMLHLRDLIIKAAEELGDIATMEETLKWGEPSYLVKKGSTIRIDWKEKNPQQYAMYFKCTSKLVPAFRAVYKDLFTFEGNRAIVFQIDEELPEAELINCIKAGLSYHKVKHLPLLGLA